MHLFSINLITIDYYKTRLTLIALKMREIDIFNLPTFPNNEYINGRVDFEGRYRG